MAFFPIAFVHIPPNKMVVSNVKFITFLIPFVHFSYLPPCLNVFLGKATLTVVYIINRLPSPTTHNKSPFEFLHARFSDYSSLRVFGCVCFVSLPPHERNKLESWSHLCCFLVYGISQKGFCCYDHIPCRLCISFHVEF